MQGYNVLQIPKYDVTHFLLPVKAEETGKSNIKTSENSHRVPTEELVELEKMSSNPVQLIPNRAVVSKLNPTFIQYPKQWLMEMKLQVKFQRTSSNSYSIHIQWENQIELEINNQVERDTGIFWKLLQVGYKTAFRIIHTEIKSNN